MTTSRHVWLGYMVALVLTASAAFVTNILDTRFAIVHHTLLYVLAITAVAYLYGTGPSALALVLAFVSFYYLFVGDYDTHPAYWYIQGAWSDMALLMFGSLVGMLGGLYFRKTNQALHLENIERKQAEDKLLDSKAFLRKVIDTAPSMIFVKDWDGRFVLVNDALAHTYGTTPTGIVGKTDADFNPKSEELEHFLHDDRQVMSTREMKTIPEEPVTHANGQVHWYSTVKVPLISPDGTCDKVLGVSTDITDRKRIEENLRASEQRFQAIFDRAGMAILIADIDGKVISANPAAERLLGYSIDELIGKRFSDITHPDDAELTRAIMQKALNSDNPLSELDKRYIRKDGSVIYGHVAVSAVFDLERNPILLIAMIQDVSESKQANEEIFKSRELLQSIIDNTPTAIYVKDMEGRLFIVNQALSDVLNIPVDKLIGMTSYDFIPGVEEARTNIEHDRIVKETGKPIAAQEILPDPDGARVFISSKFPLRDSSGSIYAVGGVSTEITDIKKAELELSQARDEAEQRAVEAQYIARTLQNGLVPPEPYIGGDYTVAAAYVPAFTGEEVGGDFYDISKTEDGHIAITIGDVSGKGVASAATAFLTRSTIHAVAYSLSNPGEALNKANQVLCKHRNYEGFVTAFLAFLDPETGRMLFANAGHPPAAIHRADGSVESLTGTNVPLGILQDVAYSEWEATLNRGDKLVLYTDGISEARRNLDLFGTDGVEQVLHEHGHGTPDFVAERLLAAADGWSRGHAADDRATMVIEWTAR